LRPAAIIHGSKFAANRGMLSRELAKFNEITSFTGTYFTARTFEAGFIKGNNVFSKSV
jgi:hypothetical protein